MEAIAAGSETSVLSGCGPALTPTGQARGMARPPHSSPADTVAYHGEVWTDARGYATVRLPVEAGPLEPPLEYELRDLEPASSARITAELERRPLHGRHRPAPREGRLADQRPSAGEPCLASTTGGGVT